MRLPSFARVVFYSQYNMCKPFSNVLPPLKIAKKIVCKYGRDKFTYKECSSLCKHKKQCCLCPECKGPKIIALHPY
jgi:hypothetical protein